MRVRARTGWVVAGGMALLAACGVVPVPDAQPAADADRTPVTASAYPSMTATAAPSASTTAATGVPPGAPGTAPGTPEPATSTAPATLPDAAPLTLSVPAIGIDSPLVELGRNPDGSVEVPSLDDPEARPGWYRDSPTPGSLGPAIILGHVDSRRYGPGVFYHLADLRPGDQVDVSRADGTVARFAVDGVQEVAKRDFPTLAVYGNLDHAGLRLITCGGEFDPDAGSYESNIIVFASLVGIG